MSHNSAYDKFLRGVSLCDAEAIELHIQLKNILYHLDGINAEALAPVQNTISNSLENLASILSFRGIGYSIVGANLYAAKIQNGVLYTRIRDDEGLWPEWHRVCEAHCKNYLRDIATTIARNIYVFKCNTVMPSLKYSSHYQYMDKVIEEFWMRVFGKSLDATGCAGIVGAHGDKCYQYRDVWEEAGVPFYHGALLYMLTYTSEMVYPKHQSQWAVIELYIKHKQTLVDIDTKFRW